MPDYDARYQLLERELEEARERIAQLEAILGTSRHVPLSFRLTTAEARVLGVILARPIATKDMVMRALYADRNHDDEIAEPKIADVFVCKIRSKAKPFGVTIETVWGQGWRMSAESKALVQALIDQENG